VNDTEGVVRGSCDVVLARPARSVPAPVVSASADVVTGVAGAALWGPLLDRVNVVGEADQRRLRPGGYTGGACYRTLTEVLLGGRRRCHRWSGSAGRPVTCWRCGHGRARPTTPARWARSSTSAWPRSRPDAGTPAGCGPGRLRRLPAAGGRGRGAARRRLQRHRQIDPAHVVTAASLHATRELRSGRTNAWHPPGCPDPEDSSLERDTPPTSTGAGSLSLRRAGTASTPFVLALRAPGAPCRPRPLARRAQKPPPPAKPKRGQQS